MSTNIQNSPPRNIYSLEEALTRISVLANLISLWNESEIIYNNEHTRQLSANISNQIERFRIHCKYQEDTRIRKMQLQGYWDKIEQIKQNATATIGDMFEDLEKDKHRFDDDTYGNMKATLEAVLNFCRPQTHTI